MRKKLQSNVDETLTQNVPTEAPAVFDETAAEFVETEAPAQVNDAAQYLGTKLTHTADGRRVGDKERVREEMRNKGLSQIGDNIMAKREIREGWIELDRALLGERDLYYPETWQFKIHPATVEAIRNWSAIDDENWIVVNEVFNEILKSCLQITDGNKLIPWSQICAWDRMWFIAIIREYTYQTGENKVEFQEDCAECGEPVTFEFKSSTLSFDTPDEDVLKYYDRDTRTWHIDPTDFGVDEDPITLYVPTIERETVVVNWTFDKIRNGKKYDNVFVKFLPWLTPKFSKDATIQQKQIRDCELKYKHWDIPMFTLMDDVLRNIIVTASRYLTTTCPVCGEEVTAMIRFQRGVSALFSMEGKHTKFGKK